MCLNYALHCLIIKLVTISNRDQIHRYFVISSCIWNLWLGFFLKECVHKTQIWNGKMNQTQNHFIQSYENLSLKIINGINGNRQKLREKNFHSCFPPRIEWHFFRNALRLSLSTWEVSILTNKYWMFIRVQPGILERTGL